MEWTTEKISKVNEKRKKGKGNKEQKQKVNGTGRSKGGKGVPRPHVANEQTNGSEG